MCEKWESSKFSGPYSQISNPALITFPRPALPWSQPNGPGEHRTDWLPSAREAAWLLPTELTDEQKETAELWCRLAPEIRQAQRLALSFVEVVTERRADDLRGWIIDALRSEVAEFVTFANGLTADLQAVRAALAYEWSNGQVEGQVHRLKLLKRKKMYGRAKPDLPRARVLRLA